MTEVKQSGGGANELVRGCLVFQDLMGHWVRQFETGIHSYVLAPVLQICLDVCALPKACRVFSASLTLDSLPTHMITPMPSLQDSLLDLSLWM